jgi:hypothetical protein
MKGSGSGMPQKLMDPDPQHCAAQDVFMNLHKEHSKAVVQKVIDQLVEQEQIKEKVNGKQKCYVANQVGTYCCYRSVRFRMTPKLCHVKIIFYFFMYEQLNIKDKFLFSA